MKLTTASGIALIIGNNFSLCGARPGKNVNLSGKSSKSSDCTPCPADVVVRAQNFVEYIFNLGDENDHDDILNGTINALFTLDDEKQMIVRHTLKNIVGCLFDLDALIDALIEDVKANGGPSPIFVGLSRDRLYSLALGVMCASETGGDFSLPLNGFSIN